MNLKKYLEYNKQFDEKYIYRLGDSAGFFSEYNNMILSMLWCIEKRKRFMLQSYNANFSVLHVGWTQFFRPFINEIKNDQLDKYNNRDNNIEFSDPTLHCMATLFNGAREYYKPISDENKLDEYIIDVPELELKGTIQQCCGEIHKMIWHYNNFTDIISLVYTQMLHLPEKYASCHIRLGDKFVESPLYRPESYIEKLKEYTDIKDVFVLTDDYRAIQRLENLYPDYHFYTLCQPDERGYCILILNKMKDIDKTLSLVRLFTSIDIISNSTEFVGTFSANPGMAVGFNMTNEHMHCLDYDHWIVW